MSVKTRTHTALSLLRLFLLYAIFCYWVILAGLAVREWQEQPQNLERLPIDRQNPAAAPPFLGITVHLEDQTPAQQQLALQRLRASAFGWVRQRIDWGKIEATQGIFDWRKTDELIGSLATSQLAPVIVLDGSPLWARRTEDQPPNAPQIAPPADPADFANFAAEFAKRYGDRVRYYQLWDEPNIAPHWGKRWVEPVEYAQLLIAASRAIRKADYDAAILTAALAPTADRGQLAMDEIYFLQRMIAAGAAPWLDAVAIQPFGFGHAPGDSRQSLQRLNFQRAALIRQAMVAAGIGDKPIWAVRFGWNIRPDSPWASVIPENQQRYVQEAIQFSRQNWHWLSALGWAIDQPNVATEDPMWGFALRDDLAGAIGKWEDEEKLSSLLGFPSAQFGRLFFLIISLLALLWRATVLIQQLPWQQWHATLRIPYVVSLWVVLLFVYYFATWTPLIGLCWLLAMGLIGLRPQAGIWLAAATLPFYFQHKEVALVDSVLIVPPALAVTFCLLPAIILHAWRRWRQRWKQGRLPLGTSQLDLLALGWLLLNLLPSVNVWQWQAYRSGLLEIGVQPLLLYAAIRLLIGSEQEQRNALTALVVGGVLVAGYGLFDWLGGGGVDADGLRRLVGPYFSPNHAALYLLRTFFVTIGLAATVRQPKIVWLLLSGGLLMSLLLTASRGALLLGLPIGMLLLASHYRRNVKVARPRANLNAHLRMKLGVGMSFLLILLISLSILILGVLFFFLGWERISNSATLFSRFETWQAAWALWQRFPLFGVGANGFFWNYPAWLSPTGKSEVNLLHPHNLWLEFATSWGIAGLLWLFALLWFLWKSMRRHDWLTFGLTAALLAALAHAQVDTLSALPDLAAWNWMALGLLQQRSSNR